MALFKVRPSRGSWAFFVLIAVAALTRRQWAHHEQQVIRRDGPAAESARALATCLFGADIAWLMREDEAGTPPQKLDAAAQQSLWAARIGSWLQVRVAGSLQSDWPSRCVAPLDELDLRLRAASQHSPRITDTIREVRRGLQPPPTPRLEFGQSVEDPTSRARAWQIELLRVVDDNTLPTQIASLFSDVRDLSAGTRDRWTPTVFHLESYPPISAPEVPRWRDVSAAHQQAVLASPTVYFYRSLTDGRTHRVDFDRRSLNDTELGAAVTWREPPRGGVLRASTESGGAVIPLEPTTRVIALPNEPGETRRGETFDWQSAVSADGLVWMTRSQGTVRLRALRFEEPNHWTDAVTLGTPESQIAAVVAPEPLDATRWRVTLLRPRAIDFAVEQNVVAVTPSGLTVTPSVRHNPVVFPSVQRLLTCGTDSVRYIALLGTGAIAVLRIEGEQLRVADAAMATVWGSDYVLRCDAGRALIVSDPPEQVPIVVATFPVGREQTVETVPQVPRARVGPMRRGELPWRPCEVLLVDDGLVAIAAHGVSLRAWRRPLQATQWEPGGYIASLAPNLETVRGLRSLHGMSQGRALALWIEGDTVTRRSETVVDTAENNADGGPRVVETRTPYRVLMMSENSGRSFTGR